MAHIYNFLQKNHFENSSHKKFGSIFSNGTSNQPTKRGHTFSKQSAATASKYAHVEIGVAGGGAKFTSQSFFKFEHQGSGQRTWKNSFEKKFGTNQKKKYEGKLEIFRVFFSTSVGHTRPCRGLFFGGGMRKIDRDDAFPTFFTSRLNGEEKKFRSQHKPAFAYFLRLQFFFPLLFPKRLPSQFYFLFPLFPMPLAPHWRSTKNGRPYRGNVNPLPHRPWGGRRYEPSLSK